MINLRNALMTGKRLPYDAEVEYLESTGTQYIDTGVKTSNNIGLSIDCAGIGTNQWICGGRVGSKSGALGLYRIPGGSLRTCYGNYEAHSQFDANRHAIELEDGILTIDGQRIFTFQSQVFSNDSSIYLFNLNVNTTGTPSNIGMAGKIYGATLSDNHIRVRDYIPVRKGTVGYLYDRVSGKLFGNAGTGDFVLGQDVVPVEYLRHTGTQWINTGYAMADSRKIDIRVNWSAHSTTSREMMGGGTSGSYFVEVNTNGYYAVGATASTISSIKAEGTDNLTWAYNVGAKPTLSVNGTLAATDANIRVPSGTFKTAISASFAPHCDLYELDIYTDNDEQTRRMLPVRVGTEGAMMDVLTRRIYRNAGTGAFTYGNDLKYPIPAE